MSQRRDQSEINFLKKEIDEHMAINGMGYHLFIITNWLTEHLECRRHAWKLKKMLIG